MRVKLVAAGAVLGLFAQWTVGVANAATKYWDGAGTWTDANSWSLTSGGPYNQTWAANDDAVFDAVSTITGANVTFKSVTANAAVTVTAGGTLSTGGTVATVTVNGTAFTVLNFGAQGISTAAGTGFIKDGVGVWSVAGSAYTGNFTINAGTVAMAGANALGGSSGTRTLTLNGGTVRSNGATDRDLGTRFGGGIIIGGNITLGAASPTQGAMSFGNNITLGAATRQITTDGTVTLSGIISGSAGAGLTKAGVGLLTLSGTNTYSGDTTVNAGTLALGINNTLPDTAITIGNATLNVATFTDTVGTLDITGSATINLGVGGTLVFADSHLIDWTGGTLTITGAVVKGASIRFGTSKGGLSQAQLASITVAGWYGRPSLDDNGYLIPFPGTRISFF